VCGTRPRLQKLWERWVADPSYRLVQPPRCTKLKAGGKPHALHRASVVSPSHVRAGHSGQPVLPPQPLGEGEGVRDSRRDFSVHLRVGADAPCPKEAGAKLSCAVRRYAEDHELYVLLGTRTILLMGAHCSCETSQMRFRQGNTSGEPFVCCSGMPSNSPAREPPESPDSQATTPQRPPS